MGKIIVIEGTDGSGKQTQSKLLYENLLKKGYNVKILSFPNYDSMSSGPVKMYLSGQLAEKAQDINAYQASALFAADRFCTMCEYKDFLSQDGILILDRYVQSNMTHQAGKIKNLKERDQFLAWLDDFEFGYLGLPVPDIVLFLDVPVKVSQKLANERKNLKTGEKKDIHEADKKHLENAYEAGKYVSKKFGWKEINCVNVKGNLRTIDEIQKLIINQVEKILK